MEEENQRVHSLQIGIGVLLCALVLARFKKKTTRRRYKTRPINRGRKGNNFFITYFLPMKQQDEAQFFKYTRMSVPLFEELLQSVKARIAKRRIKDGVSAEERLAITLHFLSQGGSMQNIAWSYHMGLTTVHKIIHETCRALWDTLAPQYVRAPEAPEDWQRIAADFEEKCQFPNCLGAIDGKHINIEAPAHSGSLYFNYKKFYSIVLLAACDANYIFTLVDIGAYGSHSDGGIFRRSKFGERFEENAMNLPPSRRLQHTDFDMPYVLVGDEAFPLKTYIMRPFPGKNLTYGQHIFNYRLSRARRIIENTFGVMVARWRLLKQSVIADVNNVDNIVKAIVALHNFCRLRTPGNSSATNYCPPGYTDTDDADNGQWRQDVQHEPLRSVGRLASNNATRRCFEIRERLTRYFLTRGQVPWQDAIVRRGREPQ